MTFLNPFVLFGLAAAAIPIVLHLLNIRKLRTIEFSTLTFLKELQKSTMRRVKLRQWLLLMLRTLLVLLLVLAFSRPALKGSLAGLGTHATTTMAIILDDTYSMSLHNERGRFLKQAQSSALRLIDMMKEGDDALFLRLSDLPNATISEPTHDIHRLREAVLQTTPSYKQRTVEEALRLSARLLRQSKNFNKEIYVVTDMQKSSVLNTAALNQERENFFDPHVRLLVLPLSGKKFANSGIDRVTIPSTLFQVGKQFTVEATVHNYGAAAVANEVVSVYLDGVHVMQKSISLGAGASATVSFSLPPQRSGFIPGVVKLEDDAFDADNACYFSVYVPPRINVLLVSSHSQSSSYIKVALSASGDDNQMEHSAETSDNTFIALREIVPAQLTTDAVTRSDAVILSDVGELSPVQADQLAEFASSGGGILFFPGSSMRLKNYNTVIFPKLHLPAMLPPAPISDSRNPSHQNSFLSFDKIDFDHPIFRGMFEENRALRHPVQRNKSLVPERGFQHEQQKIESPHIFISTHFTSASLLQSVITLADGSPFVWEKKIGAGHIIGFSVGANTQWSDFPVKGIFVPLLYQSLLYAASNTNPMRSTSDALPGDPITVQASQLRRQTARADASQAIRIIAPDKKEFLLQPSTRSSNGGSESIVFTIHQTTLPGIYTLVEDPKGFSREDTVGMIPVNMSPLESNGERATKEDIVSLAERYGLAQNSVTFIANANALESAVLQTRFGIELWKYLLTAALVIALIEMFVAREAKGDSL
ncbi:MAG: BatA domain-containing protein [Bacteroidota bacterium]|nr:BatA domain-containing protein [Bacteroidota bacterium]